MPEASQINAQGNAHRSGPRTGARMSRLVRLAGLTAAGAGALVLLGGCEVDSYLDQSVIGRWEHTPTIVPILDRLASVEGPENEGIEVSKIRAEDLIPEPAAYRVSAGDRLEIEIRDLFVEGQADRVDREVDPRGFIDLPRLPSMYVDQQTVEQVQQTIANAIRDARLLQNPVVAVVVRERRRQTYTIIGTGIQQPGLYAIPRPDFRLLDAMTQAGRFIETIPKVYVIRQIPLSDEVVRGRGAGVGAPPVNGREPGAPGPGPTRPPRSPDSVIDVIEDLTRPPGGGASPGAWGERASGQPTENRAARRAPIDITGDSTGATGAPPSPSATPQAGARSTAEPDASAAARSAAERLASGQDTTWVFIDGQWVQVSRTAAAAGTPPTVPTMQPSPRPVPGDEPNGRGPGMGRPPVDLPSGPTPGVPGVPAEPEESDLSLMLTQRVIEIPLGALVAGSAQVNIIIRPGDVIRVPGPPEGQIYLAGQVARPGVYGLPTSGRMTLTRAITAAGGLSNLAVPERVEIIRMVGGDRQAIVRLNLRAIAEGTQPDVYLRDSDQINVGTNWIAFPLQVFRNGLRSSYGFGFIIDRNFGFDVFGPQRQNTGF